jgi:hypothetical protein
MRGALIGICSTIARVRARPSFQWRWGRGGRNLMVGAGARVVLEGKSFGLRYEIQTRSKARLQRRHFASFELENSIVERN